MNDKKIPNRLDEAALNNVSGGSPYGINSGNTVSCEETASTDTKSGSNILHSDTEK